MKIQNNLEIDMEILLWLTTILIPRFYPPISEFTDKIFPVCLPQPGDEDKLPVGSLCYATGKFCPFTL